MMGPRVKTRPPADSGGLSALVALVLVAAIAAAALAGGVAEIVGDAATGWAGERR